MQKKEKNEKKILSILEKNPTYVKPWHHPLYQSQVQKGPWSFLKYAKKHCVENLKKLSKNRPLDHKIFFPLGGRLRSPPRPPRSHLWCSQHLIITKLEHFKSSRPPTKFLCGTLLYLFMKQCNMHTRLYRLYIIEKSKEIR